MQAGESLSFISMPDELSIPEQQTDDEKETVKIAFAVATRKLFKKYPETFRSKDIGDGAHATEGSFQLLYPDGSYIHLVAYAIADESEIMGMGISVVEHDSGGIYLGGFLFEIDHDEVVCTWNGVPSGEVDDNEARYHFGLLSMFDEKEELAEYLASDDEELRRAAEESWLEIDDAVELSKFEKELRFSVINPTIEDIERLEELIAAASPFTVPERDEA